MPLCRPLISSSILFPPVLLSLILAILSSSLYPTVFIPIHPCYPSLIHPSLLSSSKPAQMLQPGVRCVDLVSQQVRLSDNQDLAPMSHSVTAVCCSQDKTRMQSHCLKEWWRKYSDSLRKHTYATLKKTLMLQHYNIITTLLLMHSFLFFLS